MQADEVPGPFDAFGEQGDGQRGGVGAQQRVLVDDVLDLLEDLVLERRVLEDGLDDGVAPGEVGDVPGGGVILASSSSRSRSVVRPLATALASRPSEYALPRAACSAETSLSTTSMPARAQA
ncbi:hypothetical protein GCM10020000_14740 [Streptomyces olivoverticillatus]